MADDTSQLQYPPTMADKSQSAPPTISTTSSNTTENKTETRRRSSAGNGNGGGGRSRGHSRDKSGGGDSGGHGHGGAPLVGARKGGGSGGGVREHGAVSSRGKEAGNWYDGEVEGGDMGKVGEEKEKGKVGQSRSGKKEWKPERWWGMEGQRERRRGRGGRGLGFLAGILFLTSGLLWIYFTRYTSIYTDLFGSTSTGRNPFPSPATPSPEPPSALETPGLRDSYTQLITLPFSFPPSKHPKPSPRPPQRLILVGDVHGALEELENLLDKVKFSPGRDFLILLGDLVSKGPKNGEVLDLLKRYVDIGAASCVRGNHDDRVLAAWDRLQRRGRGKPKASKGGGEEGESLDPDLEEWVEEWTDPEEELGGGEALEDDFDSDDSHKATSLLSILKRHKKKKPHGPNHRRKRLSDLAVARTLTPEQAQFLATCPLILRIHGAGEDGGNLLAVHAGIVPGVPLMHQRPSLLMNMRTIVPGKKGGKKGKKGDGKGHGEGREGWGGGRGSSTTKGRHWADVWNEWEEEGRKNGGINQEDRDGPKGEIYKEGSEYHGKKEQVERIVTPTTPTTVAYGHYAARGLDIRKWTKGLDSNCVRGGKLTALVVEAAPRKKGGEEQEEKVDMSVVSVKCRKYVD